ncbi:MAG: hypothetical protein GY754_40480 [bacterium]|nr:hypothetical protein [bacterium]
MKKFISIFIFTLIILTGCSSQKAERGTINKADPHLSITLSFNPESYPWLLGTKYPTFAIWVEEKGSGYAKTIFVSGKAGKNSWFSADNRPSSVPVWYGARAKEKAAKKGTAIDSVTGATPSGKGFTVHWQLPSELKNKKVDIFLEGNVSYDNNDFYKKDLKEGSPGYNDVNGQPSMVWKSTIETGDKAAKIEPALIGHGHVLGKDHTINPDMSNITTAKTIFDYISVSYSPGK